MRCAFFFFFFFLLISLIILLAAPPPTPSLPMPAAPPRCGACRAVPRRAGWAAGSPALAGGERSSATFPAVPRRAGTPSPWASSHSQPRRFTKEKCCQACHLPTSSPPVRSPVVPEQSGLRRLFSVTWHCSENTESWRPVLLYGTG